MFFSRSKDKPLIFFLLLKPPSLAQYVFIVAFFVLRFFFVSFVSACPLFFEGCAYALCSLGVVFNLFSLAQAAIPCSICFYLCVFRFAFFLRVLCAFVFNLFSLATIRPKHQRTIQRHEDQNAYLTGSECNLQPSPSAISCGRDGRKKVHPTHPQH